MSWTRKYRPKLIADLHLNTVRSALGKMMKNGKIPQVMLFAGPKGTGKTSTSRILGVMLNDKKNADLVDSLYFQIGKSTQKSFVDPDINTEFASRVYGGESYVVQEMDAASNRGIDDVRALRDRVMMPPIEGKMAVYILDEAHMLTTEAFNALLKLLEEPPAHAVFILATTELHKIPATIVSRCSRIDFKKGSISEIAQSLEVVLKKEGIKYDLKDLERIAARSDGSFRDGVKLLELVCQSGELDKESLDLLLGSNFEEKIKNIISAVLDKDSSSLSSLIQVLRDEDVDQDFFYKAFFSFLHSELLKSLAVEEGEPFANTKVLRFLLAELLKADLAQSCPIGFLPFELKLLEIIERAKEKNGTGKNEVKKKQDSLENQAKQTVEVKAVKEVKKKAIPQLKITKQSKKSTGDSLALFSRWNEFLELVNKANFGLASLLRSCVPKSESDDKIEIGVFYPFHQQQLNQPKYLSIVEDCCHQLIGEKPKFCYVVEKSATAVKDKQNSKQDSLAKDALEVLM